MVSASGGRRPARNAPDTAAAAEPDAAKNAPEKKDEKKSILKRIFGVFK
jgi:hypothetical protein